MPRDMDAESGERTREDWGGKLVLKKGLPSPTQHGDPVPSWPAHQDTHGLREEPSHSRCGPESAHWVAVPSRPAWGLGPAHTPE